VDYKQLYDQYENLEEFTFVIVQEVKCLRTYYVTANNLSDAVKQIEDEDFSHTVCVDNSVAEIERGRIVSASVNDDD